MISRAAVLLLAVACGGESRAVPASPPPVQPAPEVRPAPPVRRAAPSPADQSVALANEGVDAAEAGDLIGARQRLARAVELDPTSAVAWQSLGAVLHRLQLEEEAAEAAARSIALDPASSAAHSLLGVIRLAQARPEDAVIPLETCTRLDPASAQCRADLSEAYYDLDRFADAEREATAGLRQPAAHEGALSFLLGVALVAAGDGKQAIAPLARASELGRADIEVKYNLAVAHALAGDRKAAQAALDDMVAELGDDAGKYDVDYVRHAIKAGSAAEGKQVARPAAGEVAIDALIRRWRDHLDQRVTVRGVIAWKYDCAALIGKAAARETPERCTRPNFELGRTRWPRPDRAVWVVDVPRPIRPDERKMLPRDEIAAWPKVPRIRVGQEVIVTGTWATQSRSGFVHSRGLLVFESLRPVR